MTNDGWFGNSPGPYQHLQQARVTAIEEGLPLARAANTGISAVVDPVGRIIGSLPLAKEGVLDAPLPRSIAAPIYARLGDAPAAVLILIAFGVVIRGRMRDGTARDRFRQLIAAQGGDLSVPLPIGSCSETVTAGRGGTMGDIDAMAVGLAAWRLGAGRSRPGHPVQPGAGIRIHRRPGDPVAAGEPLFTLYTDTPERFGAAMAELDGGWSVGDTPPEPRPLIIDRIAR